jgi:hypothetical protein
MDAGRELKFKEDGRWWDVVNYHPGQTNDTLRELASIHRYPANNHTIFIGSRGSIFHCESKLSAMLLLAPGMDALPYSDWVRRGENGSVHMLLETYGT